MRPPVPRIVYPEVRDLMLGVPTTETPAPNFWSLAADDRARSAQGKGCTLYHIDRTYSSARKSASSATDFYNSDASGPKMGVAAKVGRSGCRYSAMRKGSSGRSSLVGSVASERVGPASYSPGAHVMPRATPLSAAFADGQAMGGVQALKALKPGQAAVRHAWDFTRVHPD